MRGLGLGLGLALTLTLALTLARYGGACGESATPCGALPGAASTPATRQARAAPPTPSSEEESSLSDDGASTE